jgi:hypothetical protein
MMQWLHVLLFSILFMGSARVNAIVLYDGSGGALPTEQGWLFLTDPLIGSTASQVRVPGGVQLTSSGGESAGYFNFVLPQMPVLPVDGGFAVEFSLALLSESHGTPHRAGFSVIVLNDAARGIELGFWEDRIWAQDDQPLFTHAEEVFFSTLQPVNYRLSFSSLSYELEADGVSLLQGALRDYSAHSFPLYERGNTIFFGDDTGSAGAQVELRRIAVVPAQAPVPELPLPGLLLVAAFVFRLRTVTFRDGWPRVRRFF